MEEWKPIKEYEGFYEISSYGRVKSVARVVSRPYPGRGIQAVHRSERFLTPTDNGGYASVTLQKHGTRKFALVHRLVAEAFIPNPLRLSDVNHKDENKYNNNVSNLEWCTRLYNNQYGTRNERVIASILKRRAIPVIATDSNGKTMEFVSLREAERNGFKSAKIRECLAGKTSEYAGMTWRKARG